MDRGTKDLKRCIRERGALSKGGALKEIKGRHGKKNGRSIYLRPAPQSLRITPLHNLLSTRDGRGQSVSTPYSSLDFL